MEGALVERFKPADQPELLTEATIFVPNRRAARALATAFIDWFGGRATLLPAIRTLGDADDLDFGLSSGVDDLELVVPAISGLERTLELARFVQAWRNSVATDVQSLLDGENLAVPTSKADAIYLARDLGDLLQQMTQEEIDWGGVMSIVPDDHAEWWQLTSTFLAIVMDAWPKHLRELGLLDPADRAVRILKARAKRYVDQGSNGPVIVAGSTGSVPSTQMLLKAVAGLPNGAVVLPGVDFSITDREWKRLSNPNLVDDPLVESHPQFGLARTLGNLGSNRANIHKLGTEPSPLATRSRVLGVALSLSDFSADWRNVISQIQTEELADAFSGVSLIEAANERQEALAVAIALRETLEDGSRTAALVTPDRELAKRVSQELKRFDLVIDDSGGEPLLLTPLAQFARKVIQVCLGGASKTDITNLLKDALISGGSKRHLADLFELIALRGTLGDLQTGKFTSFLADRRNELAQAKYVSPKLAGIEDGDWLALSEWLNSIDEILMPLAQILEGAKETSLGDCLSNLKGTLLRLTEQDDEGISLSDVPGASEIEQILAEATEGRAAGFRFPVSETLAVLEALLADQVCRSKRRSHSRLHIYGPLEVRLLDHDRVILAGLNEDTWPKTHRNDPYLNRTLRRQLGMPSPERRTGLAAHDFQQLLGTAEVILSRSSKVDKAPAVASRWLQRLEALLGEKQAKELKVRGNRYIDYANALDIAEMRVARAERPDPTPPVAARPKSLAVTDVETWIRDPYALYAKKILSLSPLDPIDREPDHLLKGIVYHAVMENYILGGGPELPEDKRKAFLVELLREHLSPHSVPQETEVSWTSRFEDIAEAYVEWEREYQSERRTVKSLVELEGSTMIDEDFQLRARADRIDLDADCGITVFDYKTGSSPSREQARTLSPQLALEAFIAQEGGFRDIPAGTVADARYLRLLIGKPVGKEDLSDNKMPLETIIANAEGSLRKHVAAYQNEAQGYISRYAPFKDAEMSGDYDHLARVREWSFGEDDDE